MRVYLDVCCLNRLFDDDSQPRVAIEKAAVEQVLELLDQGVLTDYSSEMAVIEIERMRDHDRRRSVLALLPPASRIADLTDVLLDAADLIRLMGFALADSTHLAAAAQWNVRIFLTVDDKLMRRAVRNAGRLGFRVLNPVSFVEEMKRASND